MSMEAGGVKGKPPWGWVREDKVGGSFDSAWELHRKSVPTLPTQTVTCWGHRLKAVAGKGKCMEAMADWGQGTGGDSKSHTILGSTEHDRDSQGQTGERAGGVAG